MVENLPCNSGNAGLIPGQGTKIPYAIEHLSPCATTRESAIHEEDPTYSTYDLPQPRK